MRDKITFLGQLPCVMSWKVIFSFKKELYVI